MFHHHVKHKPISLSTYMRYLPRLAEKVEQKVGNILPTKFALGFDGWTPSSTHYLLLFASFPSNNTQCYERGLLSISPMDDRCRLNADEHIKIMSYVLDLYGSTWQDVCALVGDNVRVNKSISNKSVSRSWFVQATGLTCRSRLFYKTKRTCFRKSKTLCKNFGG